MTKRWYKSKTIWFNCLVAALTVLCSQVELLREVLPDWGYLLASMFVAAVNVWLRAVTDVGLGK